ncbi:hypothetical protein Bca52824_078993 [Brassica carinata]|uniref:Uncharacterized protein n=1 Tax=Brassica carinata TaxID=52824 RepID=A0A8X7PWJ9_BRACI|nr:hypothetical protein Bca52824_078993 [Brassica carinata]
MALSFGVFITGHRKTDLGGTALVSWLTKLIIDCACAEKMNGSCVFLAAQSLWMRRSEALEEIKSWGHGDGPWRLL